MACLFLVQRYKLGDPENKEHNLGPVISITSADKIRKQVDDAVKAGARALVPAELFPAARP